MKMDIAKFHLLPIEEVIYSEAQMCEILGVKKEQLGHWRNTKKLPFLRVSKTQRFYLGADVMEWLYSRRMVMDADE
jgi:hypothetical protein